ncbi:adenylate/guanylate cyclase domain-containing protein [Rhodospirillaceae bacterium SYSU D60014]|uniref:adenylate/guanylate cyclase domain-containing protein n=1 Tax=Virgifigura deserti TaxID=2268457 RepID=UPI000E6761D8
MAQNPHTSEAQSDDLWRAVLTGQHPALSRGRRLFKLLPSPSGPRCKMCLAPFSGVGAPLMRLLGRRPWHKNPHWCTICEKFVREHPGGAEMEVALVFADVRGSTALAEGMAPAEFSRVIRRFYTAATRILTANDAIIDKLVGDEVIGVYLPGLSGPDYARRAVNAARDLLEATGHGTRGGPWMPVGVGVHTGPAFVGSIGAEDGVTDFTALGDTMNVAARLVAAAGAGEIIVSEAAYKASGLDLPDAERRQLTLKGHLQPIEVYILRNASDKHTKAASGAPGDPR